MTTNERFLENVAMLDDYWSNVTQNMFNNELNLKDEASRLGFLWAGAAAFELIAAGEIRQKVNWYSHLDGQATRLCFGDLEIYRDFGQMEDYIEASARRLAHQTYHQACISTKTAERRMAFRQRNRNEFQSNILQLLGAELN